MKDHTILAKLDELARWLRGAAAFGTADKQARIDLFGNSKIVIPALDLIGGGNDVIFWNVQFPSIYLSPLATLYNRCYTALTI